MFWLALIFIIIAILGFLLDAFDHKTPRAWLQSFALAMFAAAFMVEALYVGTGGRIHFG